LKNHILEKRQFFSNQYLKLICFLLVDILDFIAHQASYSGNNEDNATQGSQSDNNMDNAVENSYERNSYMNPLSSILFALCIVILVIIWFRWLYTSQPSDAMSVDEVDKTSNEGLRQSLSIRSLAGQLFSV
jgi:ATP-dependent Zn protease